MLFVIIVSRSSGLTVAEIEEAFQRGGFEPDDYEVVFADSALEGEHKDIQMRAEKLAQWANKTWWEFEPEYYIGISGGEYSDKTWAATAAVLPRDGAFSQFHPLNERSLLKQQPLNRYSKSEALGTLTRLVAKLCTSA